MRQKKKEIPLINPFKSKAGDEVFAYRKRKLDLSDEILRLHQEHEPYTELDEVAIDQYLAANGENVEAFIAKVSDAELTEIVEEAIRKTDEKYKSEILKLAEKRRAERTLRKAAIAKEKMYRIRYDGKFIWIKRQTGQYVYLMYDNPEDVPAGTRQKMLTAISMLVEDCGIERDKIDLVEVTEEILINCNTDKKPPICIPYRDREQK